MGCSWFRSFTVFKISALYWKTRNKSDIMHLLCIICATEQVLQLAYLESVRYVLLVKRVESHKLKTFCHNIKWFVVCLGAHSHLIGTNLQYKWNNFTNLLNECNNNDNITAKCIFFLNKTLSKSMYVSDLVYNTSTFHNTLSTDNYQVNLLHYVPEKSHKISSKCLYATKNFTNFNFIATTR